MGLLEFLGLKRRSLDDVEIKTIKIPGVVFDTGDCVPRFKIEKRPYDLGVVVIDNLDKGRIIVEIDTEDEKLNDELALACLECLSEYYKTESDDEFRGRI